MAEDKSTNTTPAQNSDNESDAGLGFGNKWTSQTGRFIHQDGHFNINRQGLKWTDLHLYQWLVTMSWSKFSLLVLVFYILINSFFALIHLAVGIETLTVTPGTPLENFASALFFSIQTFTTVGYGSISPQGTSANIVASLCALVGLMSFALATGLFFARFSRPSAKILFSKNALIAPYQGGKGLMFRMINGRSNELLDLYTQVVMTYLEVQSDGALTRKFHRLELEREKVYMFPLNWTVVHPITPKSPLYEMTYEDFERIDAEFLIIIRAYDDTFAQQVHVHSSYVYKELQFNKKFMPMYYTDDTGRTILEVEKLDDITEA